MEILFASSELAPMAKVGGLADVVAALSKALRLLGHRVTIAIPRYAVLEASGLMLARRLTPMTLEDGTEVTIFDGRLGSGVDLLAFDVPGLYDRGGVYGDRNDESYADNSKRFGVFSRAVAEMARQRDKAGSPYDVVHVHDWTAAPAAYLLKQAPLARTRVVLTIHNLAHQGVFDRAALADLGLDATHFLPERLEFYGGINFLKAGIIAADAVTTVSTTYASEIQTPEMGEKLDGVLRSRKDGVTGIVNGIDYAVYNPMTDPALAARYDAEDTSNKGRCKSALLAELGLELNPERPLIASVGRVVHQKGSDLIAAAMPKILKNDVSVVVAGSGDPEVMHKLESACAKAPERAFFKGAASDALVHRILAAADLVMVPSRYEPCGLVQLYAQRYGALPVAHKTGGLVDTIVDCDAALETGTGFLFDKPTSVALAGAVQRALAAMTSPQWPTLRRRVMRADLGWDRPARRYASLYRSLSA